MEKQEILKIKISDYMRMLRDETDKETVEEINQTFASMLSGVSSGIDLHLLQLNKDLLVFICKRAMAVNHWTLSKSDENANKIKTYDRKIKLTKQAIERKSKEKEVVHPYKSFVKWLFALKKYFGSDVDKNDDLMCLIEATNQMMGAYQSQKEQIQKQKAKKK